MQTDRDAICNLYILERKPEHQKRELTRVTLDDDYYDGGRRKKEQV